MTLLLVADHASFRQEVKACLDRERVTVEVCEVTTPAEFTAALATNRFEIVVIDNRLAWSDGLTALKTVRARAPDRPIILCVPPDEEKLAVEAMLDGLDDYVLTAPGLFRLPASIHKALALADERRRAKQVLHALGERVKEKTVLLKVMHLFQDTARPVQMILSDFVNLLPAAWQYPDMTAVRLAVSGEEWKTPNFIESPWTLATSFHTADGDQGTLEIVYAEERPEAFEGPFLAEERELLDALGQKVGSYLDRKRTEERAQEAGVIRDREWQWFRTLIENATDIVSVLNLSGTMRYHSPSLQRVLGYAPAELEGKNVFTFIHPDDHVKGVKALAAAVALPHTPHAIDVRFLAKDQTWHDLEVTGQSAFRDGRPLIICNSRDVTEWARVQKELRFRQALLIAQLESSIDGVLIVDQEGNIFTSNQRFLEIWGFSQEDLARNSDAALLEQALEKVVDAETFLAHVQELYAHRTEKSRDEVILKDGRTLDRYSSPITDPDGRYFGRVWMFRDITDYKRIERSLRQALEEHQKLAEIVNRSPAVAFRWLAVEGWPVEFVSDNVRQFGYTPEELTSGPMPYAALVHPDDLRRVAEEVVGYTREGREAFRQEYRILDKIGMIHWVDDRTWVRRGPDGTVTHYQGVVSDITERKRLESQTEHLARQTLMGHLFSGLGHELKNPLFILRGRLQLLREKLTQHEYDAALPEVERLGEIAGRLDQIMQRFLSLLKPYQPALTRCSVTSILDRAIDFLSDRFREHRIQLVRQYAPDLPDIWSDERGLYETFLNLLINACQAIQEVSRPGLITVTAAPSGDRVEIRIQDNGPGIAPEHRSRLFEPFFTTRADQDATGLGLWTARSQMMALKGSISCESQVGEGTTFILKLPALKEAR